MTVQHRRLTAHSDCRSGRCQQQEDRRLQLQRHPQVICLLLIVIGIPFGYPFGGIAGGVLAAMIGSIAGSVVVWRS